MKTKIALVLTGVLALAGLVSGSVAQADSAPAQAVPAPASCMSADRAVCEVVPGGIIVPVSMVKAAGDVADGRIGLFDYSYYTGLLHTYRVVGGEPGYKLQPEMYNKASSVINKTNYGWWLHDPNNCYAGTRVWLGAGKAFINLYEVSDQYGYWSNRISSITWLDRGYDCS